MSEKQVKDYDKFNVRFPDGMRDAVAERAKRNGRSMNAEIIQIIEDAIAAEESGFPAGDARELRAVIRAKDESIDEYIGVLEKMTRVVDKLSKLAFPDHDDKDNKKPT
ncbi:Arc family DNA-binding protein [Enterobacter sp. Ap-916]|uniref:Arc family DNA-binding protein n=1 Tax=Enterobacteriaceae TaxID=543 RepID=UPI001423B0E2|nr:MULTISPECIES: Arc family DNA-binding protein [unclassified Enterobacter]NIF57548.1 Arc family DNA-binding protein [Enterobacter sp. Ap-867]NIG28509.1 Arc family DNA-binding protein [Enterobacter sp. Ap-916]